MKEKLFKLCLLTFLMLNNAFVFASETPENTGESESIEDPETSINTRILWLVIAGIGFAFYYYSNQRKKQVKN